MTSRPSAKTSQPTSLPTSRLERYLHQLARLKPLLERSRWPTSLPASLPVSLRTRAPTTLSATAFPDVFAGCKLDDPAGAIACRKALVARKATLQATVERERTNLAALEPTLRRPIRLRDRLARRQRRGRPTLPAKIVAAAEAADAQLAALHKRLAERSAAHALVDAAVAYLDISQKTRVALAARAAELAKRAAKAKAGREAALERAEAAKRQAADEESRAEVARRAALLRSERARTEAGRVLGMALARLETVRLKQARLRTTLLTSRATLVARKAGFETFRGDLLRQAKAATKGWPKTAPTFDTRYDQIVAKLIALRPEALEQLWGGLRGLPDPPGTDLTLPAEVTRLRGDRPAEVDKLMALAKKLAAAAEKLDEEQETLAAERLKVLVNETSALNRHRTRLLPRLSADKRAGLVGIGRVGVAQLLREVQQLVLDSTYWALNRLRQLDQIPRLVLDIFTVGSTMWFVLKLLFLLWLLRFVLKRWDGWLAALSPQIDRFIGLGRYNKPLTRLVDLMRHSGRPLVILIAAVIAIRLAGGAEAPTEARVLYLFVFWIAIYRLQLRVVESAAKHVGLEKALKAAQTANEELLEEDPDLEGPPAPRSVRLAAAMRDEGGEARKVVPGPVLAVRSVRAATRYILVVILLLELTSLAVGHGTIYNLTARFSWLATLPFLIYFLRLWRPHIAAAYMARVEAEGAQAAQRGGRGEREPAGGALGRLIDRSKGRFYGVFVIGAAFGVVFAHRIVGFGRRYLTSLDATKKLLAFFFRRNVERRAQQAGQVRDEREPLPEALLAHFPMGPLTAADRPEVLPLWEPLSETVQRWSAQRADGSIALVGAAGVGKTTTLNLLEEQLEGPLTIRRLKVSGKPVAPEAVVRLLATLFALEGVEDEEALVEAIRRAHPPPAEQTEAAHGKDQPIPLVVLDDCHHLFLRYVGGFAGWKLFVRVVDATCDRVLWLMTFDQTAWDYLTNAAGRMHHFRRVITMPLWDEEQLQRLIISRMRRARYRTSFSELMKVADLQGPDIGAQLERTKSGYFRMLWDATAGNPRVAVLYWLRSIEVDLKRRLAQVRFFASPRIERLQELPEPYAFVLTAIAEHGKLLAEEVARATNLSLDFCRSSIRLCLEEGLLERERDDRVKLSTSWQPTIKRYLKRKHMLRNV